jgi:hypothetical protein
MSLNNISLTKSWYETRLGVSADYQFNGVSASFRDGSYSIDTLLVELNYILTASYIVVYDFVTNKFTFTKRSGSPTFKPVNCGYLLGLVDGVTYSNTFTSINSINVTYSKIIYVNTNLSGSNSIDNIYNSKFNYSTILGIVPIPVASFDILNYQNNSDQNGIEIAAGQISSLRIFITTERGSLPTLSEDFSISLKIQYFQI